MTVIAWDGETLAADKRSNIGSRHVTVTKIFKRDGMLIGGAGHTMLINQMVEWISLGCNPHTFPDANRDLNTCVCMMVISKDKKIHIYENVPFPIIVEQSQHAIGSGSEFARMAMHLGKKAREAVELTCLFDSNCGNGIDTLRIE